MITSPPAPTEAPDYYFRYISKVPAGTDIRRLLEAQLDEMLDLLAGVSEEQSRYRYAPGKWSIREVMGHVNDCERLFVFRAMWFARGFASPLPGFDQDAAMGPARFDEVPLRDHAAEFRALRQSTVRFFNTLPDDAWMKRGTASDASFSVRALAYITAGHVEHHAGIVGERYLGVRG
jgi:hypothetical protein